MVKGPFSPEDQKTLPFIVRQGVRKPAFRARCPKCARGIDALFTLEDWYRGFPWRHHLANESCACGCQLQTYATTDSFFVGDFLDSWALWTCEGYPEAFITDKWLFQLMQPYTNQIRIVNDMTSPDTYESSLNFWHFPEIVRSWEYRFPKLHFPEIPDIKLLTHDSARAYAIELAKATHPRLGIAPSGEMSPVALIDAHVMGMISRLAADSV